MKKTIRRALAMVLALSLLLCAMPMAFAAVWNNGLPEPGVITVTAKATDNEDGTVNVSYHTRTTMIEVLAEIATVYRTDARMQSLRFVCTLTDALSAQMKDVTKDDFTFTSAKWQAEGEETVHDIFLFERVESTATGIKITYKLNPEVLQGWHFAKAADVKSALMQPMTISTRQDITAEQRAAGGETVEIDATIHIQGEGIQKYFGVYTILAAEGEGVLGAAVTVDCDGGEYCPSKPYIDVDQSQWYHLDVDYVIVNGLMNGTAPNKFAPNGTTTRGMIVTILHRLEGTPVAVNTGVFPDVKDGQWYTTAVSWGAANGIVNGYGNGNFGPNDPITREQMAAILYRYAQYKGYDTSKSADLTVYSDYAKISSYALPALSWANAEGLISGMGNGILSPGGKALRAQVAAILHRFCENVVG